MDGVWLSKSYMDDSYEFSLNTKAYPSIKAFKDTLKSQGKHLLLSVNEGLASNNTRKYYNNAVDQNALIKSTANPDVEGGKLTQKRKNLGKTVFLDWFAPASKDIFADGLNDLHKLVPYDGICLDLNEVAGECNGECPVQQTSGFLDDPALVNYTWYFSYKDQENLSTYNLPFVPGPQFNLDNQTLSLNATHNNSLT